MVKLGWRRITPEIANDEVEKLRLNFSRWETVTKL